MNSSWSSRSSAAAAAAAANSVEKCKDVEDDGSGAAADGEDAAKAWTRLATSIEVGAPPEPEEAASAAAVDDEVGLADLASSSPTAVPDGGGLIPIWCS